MAPALRFHMLAAALAVALTGGQGWGAQTEARDAARPVRVPGITIENFGNVDGGLFRGAQPTEKQLVELARLGVRTIVAARTRPRAGLREAAERLGMQFVVIPLQRRQTPKEPHVAEFLQIATDRSRLPLFVFCSGGRHRSGVLVAVYRVAVSGRTANDALREMKAYGFYNVLGLHSGFRRYVGEYYRRMRNDPTSVPLAFPGTASKPPLARAARFDTAARVPGNCSGPCIPRA